MTFKKTTFTLDWADAKINPQWSTWLRAVPNDPYRALCTICSRNFSLSNMGRQAIKSHESSRKHIQCLNIYKKSSNIQNFVVKDVQSPVLSILSESPSNSAKAVSVMNFLSKEKSLEAEIIWSMKIVFSHSSYNAFNDASHIFKRMFPDSEIAKTLTVGRTKLSYLISFGIAPVFKKNLLSELSGTEFVICFDEALNAISQRNQMDLYIRFWMNEKNEVSTRYLTSIFMGHTTAEDLKENFFEAISELDRKKLFQISMDGPNVNLKFLREVKEKLEEEFCEIIDIGSCGLHVIHGAFRTGHKATEWNLNSIFRASYQLFKDSPARRADFIAITGCSIFPLKFCEVRWLENIPIGERFAEIFPSLKKYIENSKSPCTATVEKIKKAFKDKLLLAKIYFFLSVAAVLDHFLKTFQTAHPVVPFLYESLYNIINQLMSKFIKHEVLNEAVTSHKLLKIDILNKNNYCSIVNIDIGIAAGSSLAKSEVSELQKRDFRLQCRDFLVKMTQKIIERCPLKFPFVKYASCLDPKFVLSNAVLCQTRMEHVLEFLYEKQRINPFLADRAKKQFEDLILQSKNKWNSIFLKYSKSDRLDHFYSHLLNDDEMFQDIWKVIKLILILSHGNATVESGFSINKDMLVENLKEHSLISLRTVYDGIKTHGGVLNVPITKELKSYVKTSHLHYQKALEHQKKFVEERKKRESEKRKAVDQIKMLQLKKKIYSRISN